MLKEIPARRAMAMTWMMALVEPPMAMCTRIALSKAAEVMIRFGTRSSHTISTMRRPARPHMRGWLESTAGIDEAPGSASPSASAIAIIVAAVPMTMQVPTERAIPPSISLHSASPRLGALFGPVFPHVRAGAEIFAAPVAAQHGTCRNIDRGNSHADRAHDQAGCGLVTAAHQHRAVDGMTAQELLGLHRQQIAVEHRRRLDEDLAQRQGRQFDRKTTGLQHATFDVFRSGAQMAVTGIEIAPGIDDADDGLAVPILGVEASLTQPGTMAESPQIVDAEPAVATQLFGLAGHSVATSTFGTARLASICAAITIAARTAPITSVITCGSISNRPAAISNALCQCREWVQK